MSFFGFLAAPPPSGSPYAAYAVYDAFADANGTALTSHAPEQKPSGATWENYSGTAFSIQSNKAICSGGNDVAVAIDSGVANCTISVESMTIGAFNGISARLVDGTHLLLATYYTAQQRWELNKLDGSYSLLGNYPEDHSAGDIVTSVKMTLSGSTVAVLINGVSRISVTETFNQTATKHGLYGYAENGTAKWDLFSVA